MMQRGAADVIDFIVLLFLWATVSTIIHLQSEVVFILVAVVYFTLLEGRGQTVGKILVHIRVVSIDDGQPIGYRRALIRDLARTLSWIPFGLGYLWMLWSPQKQTWHDVLSHAVVVPLSERGS
jgi:uncharacterized RDD family membrane protein YckC